MRLDLCPGTPENTCLGCLLGAVTNILHAPSYYQLWLCWWWWWWFFWIFDCFLVLVLVFCCCSWFRTTFIFFYGGQNSSNSILWRQDPNLWDCTWMCMPLSKWSTICKTEDFPVVWQQGAPKSSDFPPKWWTLDIDCLTAVPVIYHDFSYTNASL